MINGKFLILVVDDEPKIRMLVKKWLLDGGYNVDTAIDGNDCINKLKPETDFILLDIMMPGSSPDHLIDEIVKNNPNIKIVYLTAVDAFNPTFEQQEKGWVASIKPPVIGYIQKPVEEEEFLRKVRGFIKKKATVIGMSKEDVIKY